MSRHTGGVPFTGQHFAPKNGPLHKTGGFDHLADSLHRAYSSLLLTISASRSFFSIGSPHQGVIASQNHPTPRPRTLLETSFGAMVIPT